MAKKKSSFYHTRQNRVGLNLERAAEILGVTVEDVREFDKNGNPLAERVLILWDSKAVGVPGWDGFRFVRGSLVKGNRRWSPSSLLLWQDQAEELERLKTRLRRFSSYSGLFTAFVDKFVDGIRKNRVGRGFDLD